MKKFLLLISLLFITGCQAPNIGAGFYNNKQTTTVTGSSVVNQLGQIGDVSTSTLAYGHTLIWDGSKWQDSATSSFNLATSSFATGNISQWVNDSSYLTVVASDGTWTLHNDFPAACGAGQYASAIGDTLTCSTPPDIDTNDWSFTTNYGSQVLTPSTTIKTWFKDAVYVSSSLFIKGVGTDDVFRISSSTGITMLKLDKNNLLWVNSTMDLSSGIVEDTGNLLINSNSDGSGGGNVYLGNQGNYYLTVKDISGFVGIATTGPQSLFDISNKFGVNSSGNVSASGSIQVFGNVTSTGHLYTSGDFYAGWTTALTAGKFSILGASGNTSASGTLRVFGASTLSGAVTMSAAATVGTTLGVTGITTLTGSLRANGGAGIATTSPRSTLHVSAAQTTTTVIIGDLTGRRGQLCLGDTDGAGMTCVYGSNGTAVWYATSTY
jgi:hypothetical protein